MAATVEAVAGAPPPIVPRKIAIGCSPARVARHVLEGSTTMVSSIAVNAPVAGDIGKYRIIAQLAKGGMGNVYLAMVQGPGGFYKLVAVKELRAEFSRDESYVAMFLEEACLAARLNHPNIVQTNEFGSDGHRHFMIMEYLEGRTLYRAMRQLAGEGGLPLGAHLRVISEALRGLHYAHELRGYGGESLEIVHRDVSPMNVLMTFDGQAKVLDFGIAKSIDSEFETRTGVLKGRIAYMAPEQACGGKVDRRADIYSVGVMIWEAVAGRRLWPKMSDVDILSRLLREGTPSLRAACPHVAPELDAICARAMARNVDERYPTAAALAEDLDGHIAGRNDAMSARDIGALLGRGFEQERAKINAILESAIARTRDAAPVSGTVRTLHTPSGTHRLRASHTGRAHDPASLPAVSAHAESIDSSLQVTTISSRGPASGEVLPAAGRPPSDAPGFSAEPANVVVSLPDAGSGRWGRWIGAAVVGVTLPVLGLAVFGRHVAPTARAPAESAGYATAQAMAPDNSLWRAVPAQPVPESVDVVVRATPSIAQIAIDGKLVATNPHHGHYPKDRLSHRVTISADGYETKLDDVVFSGDVSVDVSLDRRQASEGRADPARVGFTTGASGRPDGKPGGVTNRGSGPRLDPNRPASRPSFLLPIATSNPYYVP